MSSENIKKCNKCQIDHWYVGDYVKGAENLLRENNRIFKKNGKYFCFNCLASEYPVHCHSCHKRINNSNNELGVWTGVTFLSRDCSSDPDSFRFECRNCSKKWANSKQSPIYSSEWESWEPKKCRMAGCSRKSYYKFPHLCQHHSKTCQGTRPSWKEKCGFAIGIDEDFCKECENHPENHQKPTEQRSHHEILEEYRQVHEKAQKWWDTLSSSEREKELARVIENLKLGKYSGGKLWQGGRDMEGYGSGWTCDGSFWQIKNGKYVSDQPHLVPSEIAEEFAGRELGDDLLTDLGLRWTLMNKDSESEDNNSPKPNSASGSAPQTVNNSNGETDNSVKTGNSPKINSEKKENNRENNSANPASENSSSRTDNETLTINLKNVKKITRTVEGNLVIEFKNKQEGKLSQTITPNQINNSQELQTVKNYLEKNNQISLSQRELDKIFSKKNNNSVSNEKPQGDNNALLIGGIGILIIGIGIGLFLKRNKKSIKKAN